MFAAHLGALACVGLVEINRWAQLVLGAVILVSFVRQWQRTFWWKGGELNISEDGFCSLTGVDAPPARILCADMYAGFVRLRLAAVSGHRHTLLLMQDALLSEAYHELCARIRQGRLPVPDQAAMREPL